MSEYGDGFDAYVNQATETKAAGASPHQLVLMLIDGLLDELARAEGHMRAKRFEQKGQSIRKCMDILGGLDSMLDMQNGGEVAIRLRQNYEYCGRRLFEISLKNELGGFAEVHALLIPLREGWEGMGKSTNE